MLTVVTGEVKICPRNCSKKGVEKEKLRQIEEDVVKEIDEAVETAKGLAQNVLDVLSSCQKLAGQGARLYC